MRVIIVGASKVGYALTKHISEEGMDVVVIDKDSQKINEITDAFDCNGYVGNAGSPQVLEKAGIASASVLIAVTKQDETNLLCCNVAKQLGIKHTVAAVRSPEYSTDIEFMKQKMGVDMLINPEKAAAQEINKIICYAGDVEIERFGEGKVNVATVMILDGSILAGAPMTKIQSILETQLLVCAIERKGKMITPKGQHQIKAGDKITFVTVGKSLDKVLAKLNILEKTVKKAVIIGGSKVGYYLTELLLSQGVKVTLVDNDPARCANLLELFPKANVMQADGTDSEFMEKEFKGADACVTVTGKDEENLIISMFAKSVGMERIAAEIDNSNYEKMLKKSGINHVLSTQNVALSGIIKDTRLLAMGNESKKTYAIQWLYTLNSGKLEAVEFEVGKDCNLLGIPFKDSRFALKSGVLIAVIMRGQEAIVADGNSVLLAGDHIIVVSAEHKISQLSDIYA